jgi:signal peptide peptidase SppA
MKFQHILQKVYHEPWLITPGAHAAIAALVESRIVNSQPRSEREGTDICGDKVEIQQMEISDGIAHIPIGGVIGIKLSAFEKGAGAVDVRDVMDELEEAEERSDVRAIILDIDSPGGMVSGTPELADRIARVEKPVFAFTDGLMASAAYWLAASADHIFATSSAEIGSIGVYIPWIDQSKRYEDAGLKVKVFRAGKFKGMGYPGTSLTEDQEELLQSRVNEIANDFYSYVMGQRPDVDEETMQGQTFGGKHAVKNGLIDGLVTSKDDVARLIG